MKKVSQVMIHVFICMIFLGSTAIADVITTIDDGSVKIFGGESVSTTGVYVDISNSGQNINRGVFEFDISKLSQYYSIAEVNLTLTVNYLLGNFIPTILNIYGYSGDGIVDINDYQQQGELLSTVVIDTRYNAGTQLEFSLDADNVEKILNTHSSDFLTIKISGSGTFAFLRVASLENTQGYTPASLSFAYEQQTNGPTPTPEPTTIAFFAVGLAGLCLVSRQRKNIA